MKMSTSVIGSRGEVALPETVRERYGLAPDTAVRIIETRRGILLIPLTSEPMNAELREEIAAWERLGADTWDAFPYEEEA
jgi:bifunctional DNA-binding transcriptional regulator/antitoxin component of YhaV-PrlF toxin-antitoxin module